MFEQKEITTRELLRNFKSYKDDLLLGRIHRLMILTGSKGKKLEIRATSNLYSAQEIAAYLRSKRPIKVKRVRIFDEWAKAKLKK